MILTYENVDICHDKRPILSHCNLQIAEGEMVYIEGAVGSGKTTLLHTIYGELKPFAGKAVVLETDLMKLRTSKLPELRRKIGMDFQDFYFLTDKTVGENLDFVLKATGWKSRKERLQRIEEVLQMVGMETKGYKMPHELSGGEQQRIVIARAILNKPDIILADEPTGNLDPETGKQIVELLRTIRDDGSAIVMSTHNHQFLDLYPGRVYRCDTHKVTEETLEQPHPNCSPIIDSTDHVLSD